MLVQETTHDVPTTADGQGSMRMYNAANPPIIQAPFDPNGDVPSTNNYQASTSSTPQSRATQKPAFPVLLSSARFIKVGASHGRHELDHT